MTGGPDDGGDLYAVDEFPCLVCGRAINLDWDGVLCWHFVGPNVDLGDGEWCPGSRTAWEVPA